MKKQLHPELWLLHFLVPLPLIWMLSGTIVQAQSFELFAVSDLSRVFEDGYGLPVTYDTLKVFGIRGEIVSGQFAIKAKKDLNNVTIEVSEMKDHEEGAVLSEGAVGWNFVGSIPLGKNAPNQPAHATVRSAPARFPDYLIPDPQVLYQAKREVIEEMQSFDTPPKIYVQTNPPVNSTVVRGQSYLVELFGWTETGTKIVANGEDIPVDEQGLFLWNLQLSEDNNSIVVQANNEQGSKRIVREFVVAY